jgi:hypothetical protein
MENNTKKEWVDPEMMEFEVLSGSTPFVFEDASYNYS